MPQDPLQIALEHHRAGRLLQAESGYESVLADDAAAADAKTDAAFWLGVLLTQAGQSVDAVPLLERASAARPDDPAFAHNLGCALLDAGRTDDAISTLRRAADLAPTEPATLVALARALLTRRSDGDAAAAADLLARAIAAGADATDVRHDLGAALLSAGRPAEAVGPLVAAAKADPNNAAACYAVALAYRAVGDAKETRRWLTRTAEADAGHARAWHGLGTLDYEAGNYDVAAGLFRRAVRAQADYLAAHSGLAAALSAAGRHEEAAAAAEAGARAAAGDGPKAEPAKADARVRPTSIADLERRLTPDAAGTLLHDALAKKYNVYAPQRAGAVNVANLFDRYADTFDAHLRGSLRYRAPELIAAALARTLTHDHPLDVLDAGCGTGLCGPLLRPVAASLVGVDLSPAMVEKSRAKGVYDRVEVADLTTFLAAAPNAYDLIVAADVFVYVGELASTFEAAFAALRPRGLLAFTVEAGDGDRYTLDRPSHRYRHSAAYLKRLASIYGFAERAFEAVVPRINEGKPVEGYLVVLEKP